MIKTHFVFNPDKAEYLFKFELFSKFISTQTQKKKSTNIQKKHIYMHTHTHTLLSVPNSVCPNKENNKYKVECSKSIQTA